MNILITRLQSVPSWLSLSTVAFIARFVNLGSESLWYDESFTAWLAKLEFPNMMKAIAGDVHPPLWYIVEWFNVRLFGNSEFALRVPSAVLGVLIVLLTWRLAQLCQFEKRTAWYAGLLAAFLPGAIYYSQDARMYPLLTFFILWAAISAIKDNWLFFSIASIGALYTQNLAVVYIAAIGIATMISKARMWRQLIKPMLAAAATLIAWLAWSPVMAKQLQAVGSGFWIQPLTMGGTLWPLASMTLGWRLPDALQLPIYVASFGVSGVGLIACRKWILSRSGLIVLALVLGAPTLAALISVLWRSIYLQRAFLPSALGLMLLWAYPMRHLSRPNRAVMNAITVPTMMIALLFHYSPANGARQDFKAWSEPIRKQWQSGDVIYHAAIDSTILTTYYLPDKPYYPYYLLPHVTDLNQSLTDETKEAMGLKQLPFNELKNLGYKRAWFIATETPLTSKEQFDFIARIRDTYHPEEISRLGNERVSCTVYLINLWE